MRKTLFVVIGALVFLVVLALVSIKKRMFVWVDSGRSYVLVEARGGGLEMTLRFSSLGANKEWRANAGWFKYWHHFFGGYDTYYIGYPDFFSSSESVHHRLGGFQFVRDIWSAPQGTVSLDETNVVIPLWAPVAVLGIVAWRAFRRYRREERKKSGHCLDCGYPLITDQQVCSECGTSRALEDRGAQRDAQLS